MPLPKVGLITLSLPRERRDLAENFHLAAINSLKKAGLDVVPHKDISLSTEETVSAARELRDNGVDCLIYLIGTWVYPPMIVTATQEVRMPFVLWAMADPQSFSLVGGGIVHGSLDEIGIKHKFVYGLPDDQEALKSIVSYARAAMVVNKLKGSNFGLIGGRSMGMYTAMVDMAQVKRIFGVEIEHVDQYQLWLLATQISDEKAREFYEKIKKEYGRIEPPDEIMMKSIKLYMALKKIVHEKKFDFIGVKCQPEMIDNYVSCCLGISLLNDDGIVTACEADINAALTMQIMHILADGPVLFADVNHIDMEQRVLRLVNCGAAATTLARDKKDVDWGLQYEYMGKKRGATTVFCCRKGKVTLARLSRVGGAYVMQIASGESFEQSKEKFKEARGKWPHAFIKLDGDPKEFLQNIRSNHLHMAYGNFKSELLDFCEILGIKPILT
ncbi:hypothetical protein ES703_32373 [subsurface metagenome]